MHIAFAGYKPLTDRGVLMNYEQKGLIHDYLYIDRVIKHTKKRLEEAQKEFRAQNFYGRTDFNDVHGVKHRSFRLDNKVCNYIDYINKIERRVEKNERRKYHFQRYLSTLDKHTYLSLKRRYCDISKLDDLQELGHDQKVLDEIVEIEEAISYEFKEIHITEESLKILNIESAALNKDTLVDSFGSIIEILGV